ncbi:MAG: hypothetical protein CMN30_31745 [Sandaracinus sp.]|nr:hypothetical protein [Sandaracinus sp.]|tara:strand:+ start:881 stop:1501 length:621 start_codon:yes stop_codon:yes gene_type:complete
MIRTTIIAALTVSGVAGSAAAQGGVPVVDHAEQQQQPPPGYGAQAPGYGQPQPGYGQQPAYGQQPGYQLQRPGQLQRIRYEEGMPIPPGGEAVSRVHLGMLIPGAVVFGVFYVGSILTWAWSQDARGCIQDSMLIPVVGPYIAAARAENQGRRTGAIMTGLAQTAGFALLVAGAIPRRYLVYRAGDLRFTPRAGLDGAGLEAELHF